MSDSELGSGSGLTWAARAEYKAIDRDIGENTTMLSVGIAWER